MIKSTINPVFAMSENLVQWRELTALFGKLFPRTIQQVTDNSEAATVIFCGTLFRIVPQSMPAKPGFEIWGPPHVNQFPD